jgi:hypothetical protein
MHLRGHRLLQAYERFQCRNLHKQLAGDVQRQLHAFDINDRSEAGDSGSQSKIQFWPRSSGTGPIQVTLALPKISWFGCDTALTALVLKVWNICFRARDFVNVRFWHLADMAVCTAHVCC